MYKILWNNLFIQSPGSSHSDVINSDKTVYQPLGVPDDVIKYISQDKIGL